MKKFLALVMAMMMILAMGIAFADEEWNGEYADSAEVEFNEIVKTYVSENNKVVTETLSFASTALTTNPDGGEAELEIDDLQVSSLNPGTLKVTIPSLSEVGVYEWIVKEDEGNTAGVTYSDAEVHVIALVEYNNPEHKLQVKSVESYIKKINGEKAYTYTNTFKSGEFTVAKEVQGNMANVNDEFEISVTLTSAKPIGTDVTLAGTTVTADQWTEEDGTWTYTSTLNYSAIGGKKTFDDIPVGVTVTVEENQAADKMNGYTYVSTKVGENDFTSLTVADNTNAAIVVTNDKTTGIDTGFSMDNAPYMMIMAMVVLAGVAMMMKRRAYND